MGGSGIDLINSILSYTKDPMNNVGFYRRVERGSRMTD